VRELVRRPAGDWISVLFVGVLCSGFAYILWYDALKEVAVLKVLRITRSSASMRVKGHLIKEPTYEITRRKTNTC
jgi:hypothetical protein